MKRLFPAPAAAVAAATCRIGVARPMRGDQGKMGQDIRNGTKSDVVQITPASANPQVTDRRLWNVFHVCGRDDRQGTAAAVFSGGVTRGDKGYPAALTPVRATSPEVVYFGGIHPEAGLLAGQAKDLGIGGVGAKSAKAVEKLAGRIRGRTWDTAPGRLRFDEQGDVTKPPYVVYETRNGEFVQIIGLERQVSN